VPVNEHGDTRLRLLYLTLSGKTFIDYTKIVLPGLNTGTGTSTGQTNQTTTTIIPSITPSTDISTQPALPSIGPVVIFPDMNILDLFSL